MAQAHSRKIPIWPFRKVVEHSRLRCYLLTELTDVTKINLSHGCSLELSTYSDAIVVILQL